MRRVAWLAAWPAGVVLGAASVMIARTDPDYAFAETGATIAVELFAGYALIACGLEWWRRRPGGRLGLLLVAGGCGWFLLECNNPGVGSPVVFTIGLLLYAAAPPVIAHALLTYPAASLGRLERTVIAVAYGGSLFAVGLLSALVFNPAAQGCSECPRNLLVIHGSTTPLPGAEPRRHLPRPRLDYGCVRARGVAPSALDDGHARADGSGCPRRLSVPVVGRR